MPSSFVATRSQIILGLCIPLAVLIGFFLAEPMRLGNMTLLGLVAMTLTFPLVIRWHHPLTVLSWNSVFSLTFLPGQPYLWMLMGGVSFLVALLNRAVSRHHTFKHAPTITTPLLALLGVILFTAALTGGLGVRALGSETYGGKNYIFIIAAVIGHFALCNGSIRPERRQLYIAAFFLAGVTTVVPNIVYMVGKPLYWMFYFTHGTLATEQFASDVLINKQITRYSGLYPASIALYCWLLARYGIQGIFRFDRPWRVVLFVLAWIACIYSGFRSALVLFLLISMLQFFLEGLHRTRFLPLGVGAGLLVGTLVVAFSQQMPMVMQRTLSILPIKLDHVARANAEVSTEWRLDMWRDLMPQVPRYLLKGKGYAIDPNELIMTMESTARGYGSSAGTAKAAGDYHNGPLSVLIPFGIWGAAAFLWFIVASIRYLYGNYRRGDPGLRTVNTLLLSLFVARTVFFLLIFGVFSSNLAVFVGILGFAVALNYRSQEETTFRRRSSPKDRNARNTETATPEEKVAEPSGAVA